MLLQCNDMLIVYGLGAEVLKGDIIKISKE